MPRTPDRVPGPSVEEEVQFEDRTADGNPTETGAVRFVSGDWVGYDGASVKSLTTGTGLSEGGHRALDQLVHEIAESSFQEFEYTGQRVDAIRTYTDGAKTTKVREQEFTYTGQNVTTIVTKQYDSGGTLVETLTETLAYTGATLNSITRVLT